MSESRKIVPFGKYRGKPIELLAADTQYVDWLQAQHWFRERFADLFAMLSAGQQATETPEHNAMQARFLDAAYREAVLCAFLDRDAWAATLKVQAHNCALQMPKGHKYIPIARNQLTRVIGFEQRGIDVILGVAGGGHVELSQGQSRREPPEMQWNDFPYELRIELKPTLGDDYPAVMRQMMANKSEILVVGEFCSSVVTEVQLIEIFKLSGLRYLSTGQIETWLVSIVN